MNDKTLKKSSSRNALVHGLYAHELVLPWDSKDDFEKLHADLKAEFSPRGRAEEEAVLDLATLHWQKHTLWRMRKTAVLQDPFTVDIVQTGGETWSKIRKRLRSAAHGERTLLGALEAAGAKMLTKLERFQKEMDATSDPQEIKRIEDKMNALVRTVSEHVSPLLEKLREGPNAEQAFSNAYAPESLEKLVHLEAALDARIAKVLSRLVGLKEFKRTPAGGAPPMALTVSSR